MKKLPPRLPNGKFISPKKLFENRKQILLLEEHAYSTQKVGVTSKEQASSYMKRWGGHFIEHPL